MNVPRILPLIGVTVVGVLAINVMGGARDLPRMLSAARAYAEGVAAPEPKAKTAKGKDAKTDEAAQSTAASQSTAGPLPSQAPTAPAQAPAQVGVCAPGAADLAKAANLSPGEFNTLQALQARRGQIEAQGKDVDTQLQLLAVAEAKVDAKFKAMAELKAQIETLLGQTDQKTQAEVDRLTLVYSKMQAKDSAPLMAVLDDKVRIPLAAQLETNKPKLLADILTKMPTIEGKRLTELLARRFATAQQVADNAKAPPTAAASAAPAAATPPAKDAKTAQNAKPAAKPAKPAAQTAEADPADANVDDKAAAKPKAKPRPKQVAKRAPPKKPAYKAPAAKKPVEQAKASPGPHPYTSDVKDTAPAKPADKPAAAVPPAKTR